MFRVTLSFINELFCDLSGCRATIMTDGDDCQSILFFISPSRGDHLERISTASRPITARLFGRGRSSRGVQINQLVRPLCDAHTHAHVFGFTSAHRERHATHRTRPSATRKYLWRLIGHARDPLIT